MLDFAAAVLKNCVAICQIFCVFLWETTSIGEIAIAQNCFVFRSDVCWKMKPFNCTHVRIDHRFG